MIVNNIESKISEASINNKINHEKFMTVINEERKLKRITEKYRELKESIRMMNSHRSDIEKIIPLKKGKNRNR